MNTSVLKKQHIQNDDTNWVEITHRLGEEFAKRAPDYDKNGGFVTENYQDLREHRLFSAAIPNELGGGGASYTALSGIIRELGRHCASTALAYAMHSHPVAVNVFKHRHGDGAATATLRKLVTNELIIAGTGANDWLDSSGEAERVEGGYQVNAHKRFVSGAPGAQVFVTSVRRADPQGTEVLHFSAPFSSKGVKIVETWNALGMRGTGSHDVLLENLFVPEESIIARRPAGIWHPMWNVIIPTALPLITSAYVGLAEAASELAISAAKYRQAELAPVVGEMTNVLTTAQVVLDDMVRINDNHRFTPTMDVSDAILARKAIAAEAVKRVVELAAELVGGPGFIQGHPMERMVRDVRAMHFHPLPVRRQQLLSGRVALGYDPVVTG